MLVPAVKQLHKYRLICILSDCRAVEVKAVQVKVAAVEERRMGVELQ